MSIVDLDIKRTVEVEITAEDIKKILIKYVNENSNLTVTSASFDVRESIDGGWDSPSFPARLVKVTLRG